MHGRNSTKETALCMEETAQKRKYITQKKIEAYSHNCVVALL